MKCFVSRSASAWQPVRAACEHLPIEWLCISLIETQALPFALTEQPFDWIFFSSPNSAKYFFSQVDNCRNAKIAAIGQATAQEVQKYVHVDFIGDSANTNDVAHAFAKLAAEAVVLFPISDISLRTIQKAISPEKCIEVNCYSTKSKAQLISVCDLYVFSSPSNVDAYFSMNRLPVEASVIAFGQRTAAALAQHGCNSAQILEDLETTTIAHAIKQICVR